MATPEAQRRARAAHEDRLKAKGYVKATLRLSPESVAHLAALKVSTGTPRETLINAAILAYRSTPPVQDTASNGSGDESLQAERRSREPSKSPKPPTPPAKPMKGVEPREKPVSVDVQIGPVPVKFGARLKTEKGTKR